LAALVGAVATLAATFSGVFGGDNHTSATLTPAEVGRSASEAKARLLNFIPVDVRPGCEATRKSSWPSEAIASVSCIGQSDAETVRYFLFGDDDAAQRAYALRQRLYRDENIPCPGVTENGAGTYGGGGAGSGRFQCFRDRSGTWLEWAPDGVPIEAVTWSDGRRLKPVIDWWRRHVLGEND
jgi:hypothetical protein